MGPFCDQRNVERQDIAFGQQTLKRGEDDPRRSALSFERRIIPQHVQSQGRGLGFHPLSHVSPADDAEGLAGQGEGFSASSQVRAEATYSPTDSELQPGAEAKPMPMPRSASQA